MHILHIANDFSGSKVHSRLCENLASQGVEQTIYCPVRSATQIGKNSISAKGTKVVYDFVIKPYHRYVYHIKRMAVFHSLQKKVDLTKVDLVHAATLFTDGGQAYKIYKKYHIPYVVAVRTTDVSGFLDHLPNTRQAGKKILRNAQKIFFISKALMDKFSSHKVIGPILPEIKDKMILVPNGIEDYFIDHISHEPHGGHKVLYVGDFSPNKNVLRLGEAILQLRNQEGFKDVAMTLVGGGKTSSNDVQTMIDSNPETFQYLGPIYDKGKICEIFRSHSVFAMPSYTETFGLVYLEALSQNLPVIYTKGQGIDGLFDETIGEGVNPMSLDDIREALQRILSQPAKYSNKNIDFECFRWNAVTEKYIGFYNEVLNKN